MAFRLVQIKETEMMIAVYKKGFRIQKKCGYDAEGFIIALTVGYIDAIILAQQTDFNNFVFFQKFILELPDAANYLVGYLEKIFYKTSNIDEFTLYCKDEENRTGIYEFGKKLLDVNDDFDLKDASDVLREFSKKFNVQVQIHSNKEEFEEIMMNRFTDALIINLFSNEENNMILYSSIYNANFREISEANGNCTKKIIVENFKTGEDFVSILVIRKLLKVLKENYVDSKMIEDTHGAYKKLCEDYGDRWGFLGGVEELIAESVPCENNCIKLRALGKLNCGCSLCKECWDWSVQKSICDKCGSKLN